MYVVGGSRPRRPTGQRNRTLGGWTSTMNEWSSHRGGKFRVEFVARNLFGRNKGI